MGETAAEALARYRAERGLAPWTPPSRREWLPRHHPNVQAYLRGRYERAAAGAYLCMCARCEATFYARRPAGYCSPACADAARHERERRRRERARAGRSCERCGAALPAGARADSRYCSPACRQASYRARRVSLSTQLTSRNAP